MDDVQGMFQSEFNTTSGDLGADPGNVRYDWNPAAYDFRHNFVSNAIYNLPNLVDSGGAAAVLNGWRIGTILTLNTGFPVTAVINRQWGNTGIRGTEPRIDRPNLKPGYNIDDVVLGGPDQYFDINAFELQPPGFKGNTQRGTFRGPGFATLDFSVMKDTALGFLGEAGKLEFRAEFFNLFNRANFGSPDRRVFTGRRQGESPNSSAAVIDETVNTSRQVQLALKLVF
jgi:hypothetical protein